MRRCEGHQVQSHIMLQMATEGGEVCSPSGLVIAWSLGEAGHLVVPKEKQPREKSEVISIRSMTWPHWLNTNCPLVRPVQGRKWEAACICPWKDWGMERDSPFGNWLATWSYAFSGWILKGKEAVGFGFFEFRWGRKKWLEKRERKYSDAVVFCFFFWRILI